MCIRDRYYTVEALSIQLQSLQSLSDNLGLLLQVLTSLVQNWDRYFLVHLLLVVAFLLPRLAQDLLKLVQLLLTLKHFVIFPDIGITTLLQHLHLTVLYQHVVLLLLLVYYL